MTERGLAALVARMSSSAAQIRVAAHNSPQLAGGEVCVLKSWLLSVADDTEKSALAMLEMLPDDNPVKPQTTDGGEQ